MKQLFLFINTKTTGSITCIGYKPVSKKQHIYSHTWLKLPGCSTNDQGRILESESKLILPKIKKEAWEIQNQEISQSKSRNGQVTRVLHHRNPYQA